MASETGVASRRLILTRAETSPRPDEEPSEKRLAVRTGFSSVPEKKCGGGPSVPKGTSGRGARAAEVGAHEREHHAEVDPVGDAVGEEQRRHVHRHVEVQAEVDGLVLEGGDAVDGAVAGEDRVAGGEVDVRVGEGECHVVERDAAERRVVEAAPRKPREEPAPAQRLGALGVDRAGGDGGPHGRRALEPEGLAAARGAERDVGDVGADGAAEERDDGGVPAHRRRHEVVAVDLDGRVVRRGGPAEHEHFVAGAEDEQIGEPVLETLRAERRRRRQREQDHPQQYAHGTSERQHGRFHRSVVDERSQTGESTPAAQAGRQGLSRGRCARPGRGRPRARPGRSAPRARRGRRPGCRAG